MILPRPLSAWGPLLDLFPEPLGAALVRVMAPLHAAIGPLKRGGARGQGDFDGYDGLTRRGPYERLLSTEWLLAEEMPDEFLRRAAMHEHAFLQPAHRVPRAARVCAALFDAGPDQLGTARIAHLAALIVLARRAADAGCHFEWGVLQRDAIPVTTVDSAALGTLLQARTFTPATDADIRRWRDVWRDADEIWIVGAAVQASNAIHIQETVDDRGDRALRVDIRRAGHPPRDVLLPLPDSEDCVRLLRDPFRPPRALPVRVGRADDIPRSPLVIVDRGNRVCGRGQDNDVLLFPIPGAPGSPQRAGWRISALHRPLAVGGHRRTYTVVSSDGAALYLQVHGRFATVVPAGPCPLPSGVVVPPDPTFTACSSVLGTSSAPYVLVLVGETLLRVSPLQPLASRVIVEARDVRATLFNGRSVVIVQRQSAGLNAVIALELRPHPLTLRTVECEATCCFGSGDGLHFEPFGLLALEQTDQRWDILYKDPGNHHAACESIVVPPGTQVLGPFGHRVDGRPEPALVGLSVDRRLLLLCRRSGVQVLADFDAVTWAACSPLRPQVALAAGGVLQVCNLAPWGPLASWAGRGA